MSDKKYHNTEIFGAPGVGKSTFIRTIGYRSSQDVYHEELDKRIRSEFIKRFYIPFPAKFVKLHRSAYQSKYEEEAIREFERKYKKFLELCLRVIFNSPVSAERKIRCYKFLTNAVLSWWFVQNRDGMIWDESFAKVVIYVCGMRPEYANDYFPEIVYSMPKREKYIFLDGRPEQGVRGQIMRGKYDDNLSETEIEQKLRSAVKYRDTAIILSDILLQNSCIVEKKYSTIGKSI